MDKEARRLIQALRNAESVQMCSVLFLEDLALLTQWKLKSETRKDSIIFS